MSDTANDVLLIVAHGTDLNENSAVAAKREAEKIRALGRYATVLNVYMEEPPLVSRLENTNQHPSNVVVFRFSFQMACTATKTSRRLLGIAKEGSDLESSLRPRGEIFRGNPYKIDDSRPLFTLRRSGPIRVWPISFSRKQFV